VSAQKNSSIAAGGHANAFSDSNSSGFK